MSDYKFEKDNWVYWIEHDEWVIVTAHLKTDCDDNLYVVDGAEGLSIVRERHLSKGDSEDDWY